MPKKGDHTPKENLVGMKFGKLTVIEYAGYKTTNSGAVYHQWLCNCDCGNTKITTGAALKSNHCQSCGCIPHTPKTIKWIKHNKADTRLYNVWKSMKGRCYTKSNSGYKYYGARGIEVCPEWKNDFNSFYEWSVSNGYKESEKQGLYTIDRIDPNGNYTPDNCRWVDMTIQSNNRRNNTKYMYDGELLTLREISYKSNIDYSTLRGRIDRGLSIYEALYNEYGPAKYYYEFYGEKLSIPEISKRTGIKEVTIRSRLKRGYTIYDATNKDLHRKSPQK